MQKKILVLSSVLSALCVGMLVVIATKAHKSFRVRVNQPLTSEGSAPEFRTDPLDGWLGKTLETATRPPRLNLAIGHNDSSEATPDSVSEAVSGRTESFDTAIKSQPPDPMWASDMMGSVRAAYDGLAGVSIRSLECGQTLCRLEVDVAPDEPKTGRAKAGLARAAIAPGERLYAMTASPMPPRVVVYLARENTQLPFPVQLPSPNQ